MDTRQLGVLTRIRTGKLDVNAGSDDGVYPFFTCSKDIYKINSYSYDCKCVLVAGNGDLNVKFYEGKFDAYQRTYIVESLDESILDTKYLYWFLYKYVEKLRQLSIGGVIKYIKLNNLTDPKIPLPSLGEQKEIIKILDQADVLRLKRKKAVYLIDKYIESVFLEMIGDPMTNPKKWEMVPLNNICRRLSDGPFGSKLKSEHYVESGVRVIRLQNIGVNKFIDKDKAYIAEDYYQKELYRYSCEPGDIVIATLGDPNIRACLIPDYIKLAINKADCVHCVPNNQIVNSTYLVNLLNLPQFQYTFHNLVHGQTRGRISSGQLKNVKIPIPQKELQNKFASIVQDIEVLKQRMLEQSKELENQFQALTQRSFSVNKHKYDSL